MTIVAERLEEIREKRERNANIYNLEVAAPNTTFRPAPVALPPPPPPSPPLRFAPIAPTGSPPPPSHLSPSTSSLCVNQCYETIKPLTNNN